MFMFTYVYLLFLCSTLTLVATTIVRKDRKVICKEIPEVVLQEVLGAAFNARYMSISAPPTVEMNGNGNGKRKTQREASFYVEGDFSEDIDKVPAWKVVNHVEAAKGGVAGRFKRDVDFLQEWHCKSRINWTDLGPDYFPRYLRSVECLAENCWFNIYKCRPRSFTVKVLKRKRDRCVVAQPGTKIGFSGLPRELKELWLWEERAVSFCCDCTL